MLKSPALRTATMLAAGGAGFAIANLLLARILPPVQFGELSLALSLIQVGATIAVLGLPILITRRGLAPSPRLLAQTLVPGIVLTVMVVWAATRLYPLSSGLPALLAATILFAALGRVAGAFFQSAQKFGISLLLSQSQNWVLLASVPIVLLLANPASTTVIAIVLASYVITSGIGWALAWRASHRDLDSPAHFSLLSTETLGAAVHLLAANVFFQVDRLAVGKVLSFEELATYAVVAAIAGSAFRMLQVGAGYTLTPRLRATPDRARALQVLRSEALAVFGLAVFAAAAIAIVMPFIFAVPLENRYDLPNGLVAAVIVVGFVRIWQAFAAAVVSALGSERLLLAMGVAGWLALLVSVLAAFGVREHGLTMVIYAIGLGWLAYASCVTVLALAAWNERFRPRTHISGCAED